MTWTMCQPTAHRKCRSLLQMQIQSLLPTHPSGHICLLKILSTFLQNEYQIEWSSFWPTRQNARWDRKTSRNQLITISDSESSPKVQEKIILKVRPTIFKSCIIFDIYVLPELSHVIQERLYGRTLPYGLICSLTVG